MISDFYKGRLSSITSFTRFHKTKHVITYTVTTFSFVDELELKDKAVFLSEVLFLFLGSYFYVDIEISLFIA